MLIELWLRGPVARALSFLAPALLFAAAGCVSTAPSLEPRPVDLPRAVTAESILARPTLDPELEIEALARSRTPAALLRRSFLELCCRRPQAAIDAAAEVIYGSSKPSPNEEAFARYLRAEAYAQMGKADRGRFDLERAQALALDAELQRRVQAMMPVAHPSPPTPVLAMAVEPRAAWSPAPEVRANLEPMGTPRRVTIHHSALYFRDTRPAACAAQIQRIQREHMGNRSYGDIGYHFLIDPAGRIWQGRDLRWQGAHASGLNNRQNIGICVLGNFLRGRGGQGPTTAQVDAMRSLVRQLMQQYGFGTEAIHCHSDFKATECPGPLMESTVAQMVRDLQRSGLDPRLAAAAAGP
ncbi:MAG: N-acetylmuramoyl-L-alanine amidase [Planctomycetes bacterium]|nr:N-acetylmuramoyl-L-alanine amidase [Planctomycetota bacterium]